MTHHSEPAREAVLTGIQISGRTLYKLDERGVNIWSASFQPNSGYSEVEADKAAQAVFGCLSATPAPAREAVACLYTVQGDSQPFMRISRGMLHVAGDIVAVQPLGPLPATPAPSASGLPADETIEQEFDAVLTVFDKHMSDEAFLRACEEASRVSKIFRSRPLASPAATSAETQGGDGVRIVPTDKAEALQAIIDEMTRERKAMCEVLGCADLPGVPLKFVQEQRDRLSKAWQREVELIRSWDRASLTERQELDEMRRGWGPTTPTERMRRKADVQAAMQCLSSAMADLTLSEDEAEAADDEVNRRLDEAYQRVNKQYVATIAILNSMDEPLLRPDLDAALAPSTSAATRGEPVAWRYPNCGGGWTIHDGSKPLPGTTTGRPLYAHPAPAVESAQVKEAVEGEREAIINLLGQIHRASEPSTAAMSEGLARDLMQRWGSAGAMVQRFQHAIRRRASLATDAEG